PLRGTTFPVITRTAVTFAAAKGYGSAVFRGANSGAETPKYGKYPSGSTIGSEDGPQVSPRVNHPKRSDTNHKAWCSLWCSSFVDPRRELCDSHKPFPRRPRDS